MSEFVNTSCEQQTKKRKRKTSDEQYELYLNEMENDYAFRSGSINPTLGENYLENKWKLLVDKLNATGNGPQLPVEEWKRRFKDWKNSTRAKYRKIQISKNATDGGPPSNLKLSNLEDRGLSVWGRVAVTGIEGVEEGGVPTSCDMMTVVDQVQLDSIKLETIDSVECEVNENDTLMINNDNTTSCDMMTVVDQVQLDPIKLEPIDSVECEVNENDNKVGDIENFNIETKNTKKKENSKPRRPPSLNEIANNILEAFDKSIKPNEDIAASIKELAETYKIIETKKLEIEKKKLDFQIQKYKFEHPDFKMND